MLQVNRLILRALIILLSNSLEINFKNETKEDKSKRDYGTHKVIQDILFALSEEV